MYRNKPLSNPLKKNSLCFQKGRLASLHGIGSKYLKTHACYITPPTLFHAFQDRLGQTCRYGVSEHFEPFAGRHPRPIPQVYREPDRQDQVPQLFYLYGGVTKKCRERNKPPSQVVFSFAFALQTLKEKRKVWY
jgi:hypothetical protein